MRKQEVFNHVWAAAVSIANRLQRAGLLGSRPRAILRRLGHALIPAPNKEIVWTLANSMQMIVPAGFKGIRSYVTQRYDEDLTNVVKNTVTKEMTVIDVGALLGYYTLMFSDIVGAGGKVYSFEPEPQAAEFLTRNVELNNCANVVICQKALSDETGSVKFVTSKSRSIGPIGGVLAFDESAAESISVEAVTLDDFFSQLNWPEIDLIKVDTDGSEVRVLNGMKELSRRSPNVKLIIEFDPRWALESRTDIGSLEAILKGLGFIKGRIIEKGLSVFTLGRGIPDIKTRYNLLLEK